MAIQMSNFDNFDVDQIPSKLAHTKKISILGGFHEAENVKRQFFFDTQHSSRFRLI